VKLPGISEFGAHTISIPGLSTIADASPFDSIRGNEDLAGDSAEDLSGDSARDTSGHFPADAWPPPKASSAALEAAGKAGSAAQGAEDWDTDESEDDLQIVLNPDYSYYQPPPGEKPRPGKLEEDGSEDEDEDEDLIIVDETEAQLLQPPDALAMPADASSAQQASGEKLAGIGDEKEQENAAAPAAGAVSQPLPRGGYGYAAYASPYKVTAIRATFVSFLSFFFWVPTWVAVCTPAFCISELLVVSV
jgi:hypothetical protein